MSKHDTRPVVYVVGYDASMLRALTGLLTLAGYAVQTFSSARDFLAWHQPQHRGCVVADLHMPVMSGLDLQSALARSGNPLPVVFLTGHGDIPTSVQAIKAGAEDFLTKPVPMKTLLAAIGRALERYREVREGDERLALLETFVSQLTPREYEVFTMLVH